MLIEVQARIRSAEAFRGKIQPGVDPDYGNL
jgi:hypothetical protein